MEVASDTQPVLLKPKRRGVVFLIWLILALLFIAGVAFLGGALGYRAGQIDRAQKATLQEALVLREQFELGVQDFDAARYELARQRFAFILSQDPNFPGAIEKLARISSILNATATPTPVIPTNTPAPTPTEDLRPQAELYQQAVQAFEAGDWDAVLATLTTLRRVNATYRVVEVDSLIYQALMNRGVDKIRKSSNLEGGIYDLALAERFGPLDAGALSWRNLARYYLIGSSFWEVYPELAVYYFGLAASGGPYLRDATGWTARERYRASLLHYAAQLAAKGDWCAALEQINLALAIRADEAAETQAADAALHCALLTETVVPHTPTPSLTPTLFGTLISPSPTAGELATATPTPILPPSPTASATQVGIPTVTPTSPAAPTETPTPSPTLPPDEAPISTPIP